MCGRYFITEETIRKAEELVKTIDLSLAGKREVYPSQSAPIIIKRGEEYASELCNWGFLRYDKKGLMINARSETALERRMFRRSLLERRCLIPAAGFYEWDQKKNKIAFFKKDSPAIFIAGFYRQDKDNDHFVILTMEANKSVRDIHDRMPIIIEDQDIPDWFSDQVFEYLLHKEPKCLSHETVEKK